jgi:predicted NBD/HSP70 family sugar kinase
VLDELDEPAVGRSGCEQPADLSQLADLARRAQERLHRQGRSVLGVGVAVPGLIDRPRGVVLTAPNLGWHDVDLADALSGALPEQCPIRLDNDANYAAAAEASAGVARGVHQVLYLTGTVGLGGGIVVDGQVQRGAHGFAGEVGHLPIGDLDARCACGRMGCWETSVGLTAMVRAVTRRAGTPGAAPAAAVEGDPMTVAADIAARAEDDPAVAAALEGLAVKLGRGLVTLAGTLDPGLIVLGGYFVPIGRWLIPAIERSLDAGLLGGSGRRCAVALSTLGLRAASTGAAGDILSDLFSGAIPVPVPVP